MNVPRLVYLIGEIGDDLITEAIEFEYTPVKNRIFRKPVYRICACITVLALLFGGIFLHHSDNDNPILMPFTITAYAASDSEGTFIDSILEEGSKAPISIFQTESGLRGFVLSCNNANADGSHSIAIISSADHEERISEIAGITRDQSLNYFFFIPEDFEASSFSFPLILNDSDTNQICQCVILINRTGNGFTVELAEKQIIERVFK